MSDDARKPAAEAAAFTAEEAMAFMQRMWNPFGMPMPGAMQPVAPASTPAATPGATKGGPTGDPSSPQGAGPEAATALGAAPGAAFGTVPGTLPGMLPFPNPAAMFAALDPAEVARKIDELKVIEGWLAMSLNLIQMSIKTLELQLASLEALQGTHAGAARKRGGRAPGD